MKNISKFLFMKLSFIKFTSSFIYIKLPVNHYPEHLAFTLVFSLYFGNRCCDR